jgi:hypothetical protein
VPTIIVLGTETTDRTLTSAYWVIDTLPIVVASAYTNKEIVCVPASGVTIALDVLQSPPDGKDGVAAHRAMGSSQRQRRGDEPDRDREERRMSNGPLVHAKGTDSQALSTEALS